MPTPPRTALLWLTTAILTLAASAPASTTVDAERSLRRAIHAWTTGDTLTAVEQLEGTVGGNDARSRFLLAESYRRLGHLSGLLDLLPPVGAEDGPLAAWLRLDARLETQRALDIAMAGGDGDATRLLEADRALGENRPQDALAVLRHVEHRTPLVMFLQSLALAAAGDDARPVLTELANQDPVDATLELVAAAAIRRAVAAEEEGEDPSPWLQRVPASSRYAPRAAHLRALHESRRGAEDQAAAELETLLRQSPDYDGWLDAAFTLGSLRLEAEHFEAALSVFDAMESHWQEQQRRIENARSPEALQALWQTWSTLPSPEALPIDRSVLDARREQTWRQALDLRAPPQGTPPDPLPLAPGGAHATPLAWPTLAELSRVEASSQRVAQARYQRWRAAGHLLRVEQDLARRDRYLGGGADDIATSQTTLDAATSELDSLLALLDGLLAQLHGARDTELLRIGQRTRQLLERARAHRAASARLRHFYLEGPMGERLSQLPEGVPQPAEILTEEERLMSMLGDFVRVFAERAPPLVARSCDEIWEPRILGDAPRLAQWARQQLQWSIRLAQTVDSTRVALDGDRAKLAAQIALSAADDSMAARAAEHDALRQEIGLAVLERAQADLELHREAIDYGLATASYEVAVTGPPSEAEPFARAAERERAIAYLTRFLERHPDSHAVSQTRFSLADLLLLQARDDFHTKMAAFLAAKDEGRTVPVPYLDVEPALDLYRAILADDPGFAHRDATLFHLGMILADAADPAAEGVLEQLIDEHPDAPFVARAHLRLGDTSFEAKDFARSVRHFEAAARGDDPQVTAIALYKLGWSHFNVDAFESAADAFRRLLDLYGEGLAIDAQVDLRTEAEDDLIHSLARAGGAPVFQRYFDELGPRPYEQRVLQGMSYLMKRYALYREASEVDELFLKRYPTEPTALDAARRLVDSYERGFDENRAMQARLLTASYFTPGSEWHTANSSDSLRTEGSQFAQASYRTVALHRHRAARESRSATDWEQTLSLYDTLLRQWPDQGEAPRFSYLAGECAQELKRYEAALRYYTAAAASDTASFADDAAWQRVAVTDAWYESTRSGDAQLGADSLAVHLIEVGEQFGAAHPSDERVVELRWRAGNLSFAHGWYDRASTSLRDFVARHRDDPRAPTAAQLGAEADYRQDRFEAAGRGFEAASSLAKAAGQDSLATRIEPLIPHCYYRHAESVAGADSSASAAAPPLFAEVARRWPDFEHAPLAWYRAGLGYLTAGDSASAVGAWEALLAAYPASEYSKDAHLQIAHTWETGGDRVAAARAYERYAQAYPQEKDAADALLKAADLLMAAGDVASARRIQDRYLEEAPQDLETAFEIRESRARGELAALGGASVSTLLRASTVGTPASELSRYLELAKEHPDQAAKDVVAQVRFLEAEESWASYERVRLTQPLQSSIELKKEKLGEVLQRYGNCAELAVTPWAQAAAYKVGEALVHFGDALMASERPPDLTGDDLRAYDEVLQEQSWEFFDRGEQAWTDLLRETRSAHEWIERTRHELFPRVARRFIHVPTVEYPVVKADPPVEAAR